MNTWTMSRVYMLYLGSFIHNWFDKDNCILPGRHITQLNPAHEENIQLRVHLFICLVVYVWPLSSCLSRKMWLRQNKLSCFSLFFQCSDLCRCIQKSCVSNVTLTLKSISTSEEYFRLPTNKHWHDSGRPKMAFRDVWNCFG